MKNIMDAIKDSKLVADALREVESRQLEARRQRLKQMKERSAQRTRQLIKLGEEERGLADEFEAVTARRNLLVYALGEKRAEIMNIATQQTREERDAEDQLTSEADPRIARFIPWAERCKNLAEFASANGTLAMEGGAVAMVARQTEQTVLAVRTVQELVNASVERAHQMRLEALSEAEVTSELDRMAAAIYTAYKAVPNTRPFPANYLAELY